MVVTINWANIPHGVTGKEPPPDKGVPDQSLQDLTMILDSGMNQNNNIANLELFKLMVKHTEHGNVRIRKLNELRKQKRINSSGLCEVSDSEEEEPVPNFSSYIFQSNSPVHAQPDTNLSSGSNAVELRSWTNVISQP